MSKTSKEETVLKMGKDGFEPSRLFPKDYYIKGTHVYHQPKVLDISEVIPPLRLKESIKKS